MFYPMELHLSSCILRPWEPEDIPALVRNADNIRVWANLTDAFPHPYTIDDARAWIAKANNDAGGVHFAIVVKGEAAGGIGLILGQDVRKGTAEMGYWLGEKFWGKGIATDAVLGLRRHAFATLSLNRIFARVFESNAASQRVLEKAGFTLEGRLRKNVTKRGVVMDELIYASLREESR